MEINKKNKLKQQHIPMEMPIYTWKGILTD